MFLYVYFDNLANIYLQRNQFSLSLHVALRSGVVYTADDNDIRLCLSERFYGDG